MCHTNWCFGDCDECLLDKKLEEEYQESITECPYKKQCHFETISVNSDKCKTCGKVFYI